MPDYTDAAWREYQRDEYERERADAGRDYMEAAAEAREFEDDEPEDPRGVREPDDEPRPDDEPPATDDPPNLA